MSRPASSSIVSQIRFAAADRVGSIELLGAPLGRVGRLNPPSFGNQRPDLGLKVKWEAPEIVEPLKLCSEGATFPGDDRRFSGCGHPGWRGPTVPAGRGIVSPERLSAWVV